jgi:hypothetical protein
MNDEEPKIWERIKGESSKRYYAFCLYRDMGAQERSLSKVAKELAGANKIPKRSRITHLKEWSAEDKWVARCKAWDTEQDWIKRAYMEKALKGMARKHLDIALTRQSIAVKKLQTINIDLDPEAISVTEAERMLDSAIKLERLVLGEPTEILKHSGDLTVRRFQFLEEMRDELEGEEESKIESSNDAGAQDSQK